MKAIDTEAKKRLYKLFRRYFLILFIGVIYLLITLFLGYSIPCFFKKLTGFDCPGCGATRMMMSLARLDFRAAFGYNPFLFITGPFIIAYLIFYDLKIAIFGKRPSKCWDVALGALIPLALIFGILRNIIPL